MCVIVGPLPREKSYRSKNVWWEEEKSFDFISHSVYKSKQFCKKQTMFPFMSKMIQNLHISLSTFNIWSLTFWLELFPRQKEHMMDYKYYPATEKHPQKNYNSLQSSPANHAYHGALSCSSAYVTVTPDLIKTQSTEQDFKTGREEGPELLTAVKEIIRALLYSFHLVMVHADDCSAPGSSARPCT